ncbi:hypothetical protein AB8B02_05805 [Tardiphaga sp. 862_B3_N4_1]|uniref:hypothetical protein n=1 Tax=Tardiphaga sp. 862_B3_N4_1 TaxID=3240764 RepID=UPI003F21D305
MSDVAQLGLAVDSSQAKAATNDLRNLAAASKTAEDAADRLAQASTKAATATGAIAAAAARAGVSVAEYQARTANFNATTEKMATASATATNALTRMNVAATSASSGGLAAGFTKMLGSYNAASLALQAITAASTAYYALTANNGPTVESTLSEQARLLGAVKDAYRDAADKAGKFYDQSKAILELQTSQNINALQSNIRDQTSSFLRSQVPVSAPSNPMGDITGASAFDISAGFGPFKNALEELSGTIALGAPAIEKFRNAIADIGNSNPALAGVANQLLTASQEAGLAADKVKEMQRSLRLLQGTATKEDREGLGLSNRVRAPQRDPFDSAVISANKHVAAMKADALAVGETVGQHARLRTEAQLLEAAQQKGGLATAAQVAKLKELGQAAADAAMALERSRVTDAIGFGRRTSLLSPEDAQIAAQLRGLYPDVATALNSLEASGMRANDALRAISGTLDTNLTTGFSSMLMGTTSLKDGFSSMATSIIGDIEKMIVKMLIVQPLMRSLQGMFGGGELPGFGTSSFVGPLPGYANGGMLRGGWGVVGERGPELINVHNRGVTVVPNHISKPYLPGFADGGMLNPAGGVTRLPFGQNNQPAGITFSGGIHISVPEGTAPTDAAAIASSVKESMRQVVREELTYHSRQRGMLNSGM